MLPKGLKILIIIAASAVFISCYLAKGDPTPYQPFGVAEGGYADWHVAGDIYHVEFAGNLDTSHETIIEYWNRRAKELCVENGYTDFKQLGFKPDIAEQTYSAKIRCLK